MTKTKKAKLDPMEMIGKSAFYSCTPNPRDPENVMRVLVIVLSVRPAFGRFDAVIAPVEGDGELRVSIDSLEGI